MQESPQKVARMVRRRLHTSLAAFFGHAVVAEPQASLTCISTTSPSMISVSSMILTPMLRRKACVSASVLDISSEKISEPAIVVNGVSAPNA